MVSVKKRVIAHNESPLMNLKLKIPHSLGWLATCFILGGVSLGYYLTRDSILSFDLDLYLYGQLIGFAIWFLFYFAQRLLPS